MRKVLAHTLPVALPLTLSVVLAALFFALTPAGMSGQSNGVAATATALHAMQQSIFATQTAIARGSETEAAASSPTSTPAIRSGSATGQPPAMPKPQHTAGQAGTSLQLTSTPVLAATPKPSATRQPATGAGPSVEVLAQGLNLRSGPGVGYAVLGNATLGQRLPVLGQAGGCAWLKVQLPGGGAAWTSGASIYSRLNVPCSQVAAAAAPTLSATDATNAPPTAATTTSDPRASATLQPPTTARINTPILVAPESGTDHRFSRITFTWRWDGEMQPGWGFAILAWVDNGPRQAIMDARQTAGIKPDREGRYNTEVGIPEALSQTSWQWTVAVVQIDPYQQLSAEAAPFLLHVDTRLPTPKPDIDDHAESGKG